MGGFRKSVLFKNRLRNIRRPDFSKPAIMEFISSDSNLLCLDSFCISFRLPEKKSGRNRKEIQKKNPTFLLKVFLFRNAVR